MSPLPVAEHTPVDLAATPFTPGERLLLGALVERVLGSVGAGNLERIVVFGSRARAEGHEESDLDIAVFVPGRASPQAHRALVAIAEAVQEGCDDLPHLRPILIGGGDATNPALLWAIERDGIELWAKKNG